MLEKKLKDLLVLVEGNEQVIENAVAKFSYTYNIAKEMVDVYNYVVKTLEEHNVELPTNILKINMESLEKDCKEIFEVVSYRNGLLSILIKNEISNASDQYAFENLDKFERSERKRISEKIKVLESDIEENYESINVFENQMHDLEKELEYIITEARERDCKQDEAFKVSANVNLDIEKLKLKIEKIEREIDKCHVTISRKRNEISILEFKLK